ncbi:hypothetical protein [Marilutibacter chinensis]|uniref:Uncharacterized protein n=1 Tax=Marilutibacter chinensis TaxID=2912247 RepID=A0ABS9HV30_9GAMM|nr:hypothetical protein [Lysobacter chinensis]MCF7222225.1 hypothetical protein [Lysobacter chinensis]
MYMDGFLVQALTMLGYQLPNLLACTAGLALLTVWTSAAPGRALAIGGVGMMLGASMLSAIMGIAQTWLIHGSQGSYQSMSGMLGIFGAVSLLLNLASAIGLAMLAWGACQAMRTATQRNAPSTAAPERA